MSTVIDHPATARDKAFAEIQRHLRHGTDADLRRTLDLLAAELTRRGMAALLADVAHEKALERMPGHELAGIAGALSVRDPGGLA